VPSNAPLTTPVDFDPFADDPARAELPLIEPQREIWAAAQMGDDASRAYNLCHALVLRGPLSHESMQNALQQVVDRHEALRISIDDNGERQIVRPCIAFTLPVTDVMHLPESDRAAEIRRVFDEESRHPFDLTQPPLLRARLVREADDLHRLIITKHHIVCDGWSWAVILRDLSRYYAADRQGLRAHVPPAASYANYVSRVSDDVAARADEDYWARQYADSVPILNLPLDSTRPAFKTYEGATREMRLDEDTTRDIKAAGARHGCTLFVTLLAGLETLISRLSGQDDFVLGIPMAGQALLDNTHLVGHCVNMIPLRCHLDSGASFVDHLKSVRQRFLEAQSHQQLTFGRLVQRLNVPRDPARTPLVSATFNIDRIGSVLDFGEVRLEAVENAPKHFVNFEFTVNVLDNGRDLVVICEYNTDLYTADTIDRWLGYYRTLLESVAADSGQRLDELSLLSDAERRRLVDEWNQTEAPSATDALLHQLFEVQAARTPDAIAVVTEDARLSYRELDERSNQLAHWLQRNGVQRDTPVPVCVERSLDMVVAMLGILKAGGAYVPVDPDLPAQRVDYLLQEIDAPVLITQQAHAPRFSAVSGSIALDAEWEAIGGEPKTAPAVLASADSIAYVIYTSGSTGQPKGVMIPHHAICNHMEWMQRAYPIRPADTVLQKTGYGFDASVWEFFAPLMSGAQLALARPGGHLDPVYLAEAIQRFGVTRLQLVPSQLQVLLEESVFWCCAPPLRDVFCGGEPLTAELCREFYKRLPHAALHNLYGPTETTIDATAWSCPKAGIPQMIPIGRPIDNVRAYIVDARMQLCPTGVAGELLIGGAGLARGYLKRAELTAEKFIPDPFRPDDGARVYRTGDLARRLPDGGIQYLGRIDGQVKIRGYRIEPGEIEAAMRRHPSVRQAAVVPYDDASGNKRLAAYFVAENQSLELVDQLRSHLRTALPEPMVPACFVPLPALPLNHNGKLDRKALPRPGGTDAPPRKTTAEPRTEPERLVTRMFTRVLARTDIGIHDNFFDLGGDSITAARLMAQLRAESGMDLRLRDLFERPTIAGLAEAIDALVWMAQSSSAPSGGADRDRMEL
jgi:amino acid adenylation domain-containing protein